MHYLIMYWLQHIILEGTSSTIEQVIYMGYNDLFKFMTIWGIHEYWFIKLWHLTTHLDKLFFMWSTISLHIHPNHRVFFEQPDFSCSSYVGGLLDVNFSENVIRLKKCTCNIQWFYLPTIKTGKLECHL